MLGILERETEDKPKKVRVTVIPDRTKAVMQENVRPHVETGSQIYSDDAGYYWRMDEEYVHGIVNHAEAYVQAISIPTAWRTSGPSEARSSVEHTSASSRSTYFVTSTSKHFATTTARR